MKTTPFPAIKLGVDMLSNETSLPAGAIREGVNIDIDRAGNFSRRPGYSQVVAGSGFHSVRALIQKGWVLVAQNEQLRILNPATYALSTLYVLNSGDPVDYFEHDGNVYFSNRTTIGWVPYGSGTAGPLGVPTPNVPTLATSPDGSLLAGNYAVALSLVNGRGEESGLTDYAYIDLVSGGSVLLSNLTVATGCKIRVYLSNPDGEVVYLNTEFTAAVQSVTISSATFLKQAETFGLVPMTPGEIIRGYNGRLYTVKDDTITFSEPMRYGLTSIAYNQIKMSGPITIFEPVIDGIYVGAGTKVWFLAGTDPTKFQQILVSNCRAIPRSSTTVPGEHFNPQLVDPTHPVAVWLSTSGYVVGQPGGKVVELQPDRVRIPGNHVGRSVFLLRNGRKQVVTPVNSTNAAAFGTAVDTILP